MATFWILPTMGCTQVLSQVQSISSPAPSSRPYFVTSCTKKTRWLSHKRKINIRLPFTLGKRTFASGDGASRILALRGGPLVELWRVRVASHPKANTCECVQCLRQTKNQQTGLTEWDLLLVIPKKTRSQKGTLQDSTKLSFLLLSTTESLQNR